MDFLMKIVELVIKEGIEKTKDVDIKILEFVHPEDLKSRLDLKIPQDGCNEETLLEVCKQTIKYSVKTGHRRFFNQLFSGQSIHGLAGSWITDSLNTSQYTYEVSPVFTLMEQETLCHMSKLIGYPTWDGIFCPGGSISNMFGLNIARYQRYPIVKEEGMQALPKLCIFTSEQSHYSLKKGAALLGFGLRSIISIPCDDGGRMVPSVLEEEVIKAREKGFEPFFVHATSGTTVAGAYDPLNDISDVCTRHNLWLHVDACWGGGALLSRKHKHVLQGIERSDSVAWNPHKMMGTPLQCCAFITRHMDLLKNCHCANASYLFQQDKFYDVSYDTGDKSIQCGRKVDVFKLWLMWKAKGDNGYENDINILFENARYLEEKLTLMEGFKIVFPKIECTNVCFWYVPPSLRHQEETDTWWQKVAKVAPIIKEKMVTSGTLMIGYQPLGVKVNFFRMVISNPETTHSDMDFVLEEINRQGKDLLIA